MPLFAWYSLANSQVDIVEEETPSTSDTSGTGLRRSAPPGSSTEGGTVRYTALEGGEGLTTLRQRLELACCVQYTESDRGKVSGGPDIHAPREGAGKNTIQSTSGQRAQTNRA